MTKIAFVTNSFSNSAKGGDVIYSKQIINALKHIKGELDVIELNRDELSGFFCKIKLILSFSLFPHMWRGWLCNIGVILKIKDFNKYDIVIIDHFRNSWLLLILRLFTKTHVVIVQHNFESDILKQAYKDNDSVMKIIYYYDYLKLILFESVSSQFVDGMTFITDEDYEGYQAKYNSSFFATTLLPYLDLNIESKLEVGQSTKGIIIGSFYWNLKRDNLIDLLDSYSSYELNFDHRLVVAGSMSDDFYNFITNKYNIEVVREFESVMDFKGRYLYALAPDNVGGGFKLKLLDYIQLQLPIYGLSGAMNGVEHVVSHVYGFDSYDKMFTRLKSDILDKKIYEPSVRHNVDVFSLESMCKGLEELLLKLGNKI